MGKRCAAEFFGTFWLVFGGCGAAVLATGHTESIGWLGVALAFGLTVLTMAAAAGPISGGHFNPAVTLGLAAGGRFPWRGVVPYVLTQLVAAIAAAGVLYVIATGRAMPEGLSVDLGGFATNGYGDHSPLRFGLLACFVAEFVLTFIFLFVIMGATAPSAPAALAPVAIGLCLTLIHLVGIPVTNTSVNPARSLGPAVFVGGAALSQLWLFFAAPILGGVAGALAYRALGKKDA